MRLFLFLLFVITPLLELVIIIQVGQVIGAWWTVLLLLVASLLGAGLLATESRHAWGQFRRALVQGRWPGDEVVQAALVLVGGTLLLTPGFLTDILGFVLLLRPSRAAVSRLLRSIATPAVVWRAGTVGASRRRGTSDPGASGAGASDPGAPGPGASDAGQVGVGGQVPGSGGGAAKGPSGGSTGGRRAGSGSRSGSTRGRGSRQQPVLGVEVVEIRREPSPPTPQDPDAGA